MTRSTDSRRARNSASLTIGARRRPASRPSRRRCFLASRRVEPWTEVIWSSAERVLRTRVTVLGASSSPPSSPARRRRRRRREVPSPLPSPASPRSRRSEPPRRRGLSSDSLGRSALVGGLVGRRRRRRPRRRRPCGGGGRRGGDGGGRRCRPRRRRTRRPDSVVGPVVGLVARTWRRLVSAVSAVGGRVRLVSGPGRRPSCAATCLRPTSSRRGLLGGLRGGGLARRPRRRPRPRRPRRSAGARPAAGAALLRVRRVVVATGAWNSTAWPPARRAAASRSVGSVGRVGSAAAGSARRPSWRPPSSRAPWRCVLRRRPSSPGGVLVGSGASARVGVVGAASAGARRVFFAASASRRPSWRAPCGRRPSWPGSAAGRGASAAGRRSGGLGCGARRRRPPSWRAPCASAGSRRALRRGGRLAGAGVRALGSGRRAGSSMWCSSGTVTVPVRRPPLSSDDPGDAKLQWRRHPPRVRLRRLLVTCRGRRATVGVALTDSCGRVAVR